MTYKKFSTDSEPKFFTLLNFMASVTSWINKSAPEFKPKLQTLQQQPTAVYKASAKKQNVKNVASTPAKSQKSLTSIEVIILFLNYLFQFFSLQMTIMGPWMSTLRSN
jgi:hypothetical protein